ncbi:MAG: hypothetical protein C5B50_14530 [Verrucomicrobia bacterium]|nr:MAG: hypothetical protein C5B50_14530 [Verrucomicrobiota bacterium]
MSRLTNEWGQTNKKQRLILIRLSILSFFAHLLFKWLDKVKDKVKDKVSLSNAAAIRKGVGPTSALSLS